MRIRKHAKISPLLYAPSSLKLQTHVCQLNQSPWDAMTFSPPSSPPPPPFQVNGSDARAGNGSSDHRVSVSERRSEYPDAAPLESGAAVIYCCKTDGKSWQCRREAAEGNSKCEHHLSLVKSYSSTAAKKSVKPPEAAAAVTEAPRRTRPKKAPAAASSNPYEFYYYTGFGPRWGKVRGETDSKHEGFVYEDDDSEDDEDDDDRIDGKKKRMRKPIKARSLKSLF